MKAAILKFANHMAVESFPPPSLGKGDVLIQMRAATICGTDIRIYRGSKTLGVRYPSILGHEFAGQIVDTGGHAHLSVGQRVALCPTLPCGKCDRCKRGLENLCGQSRNFGYELDGGFAELVRIPAEAVTGGNLRILPSTMSYAEGALVEPLSCVLNGQEKVGLGFGDTVVILGSGPIGCLHVMLARKRGAARIIVSDPSPNRREAALRFGADCVCDPEHEDLHAVIAGETDGLGADVVICAIGIPALAREATRYVRHRGRISLFAGFAGGTTATLDVNAIHYNEISLVGAFGLSRRNFDMAFDMVAAKQIDVVGLITDRFSLTDTTAAFEMAETGAALKVVIEND